LFLALVQSKVNHRRIPMVLLPGFDRAAIVQSSYRTFLGPHMQVHWALTWMLPNTGCSLEDAVRWGRCVVG
jgi:hypothetical protein